MHTYRKKTIVILHFLLLLFFVAFVFGYAQLKRQIAILHIGLPYYTEDILVMALSFLSISKVVYEIYRVEHHHQYEKRIKKK